MKHCIRLLVVLIVFFISPAMQLSLNGETGKTNSQQTVVTSGNGGGGDDWGDDANFNYEEEEDESSLQLSSWARLKNKVSEWKLMAQVGYRSKIKPWIKDHPNTMLAVKAAVAVTAAYLLLKGAQKIKKELA